MFSAGVTEVLSLVANGLSDRENRDAARGQPAHRAPPRREHPHTLGRGSRTAAVAEAARLGLL